MVCVNVTDSFTHLFGHRISYSSNGFTIGKTLVNLNYSCKLRMPKIKRIFLRTSKKIIFRVFISIFVYFLNYDMPFSPNTLCCSCYFDFFLCLHLENNLKRLHSQSNFWGKKRQLSPIVIILQHLITPCNMQSFVVLQSIQEKTLKR